MSFLTGANKHLVKRIKYWYLNKLIFGWGLSFPFMATVLWILSCINKIITMFTYLILMKKFHWRQFLILELQIVSLSTSMWTDITAIIFFFYKCNTCIKFSKKKKMKNNNVRILDQGFVIPIHRFNIINLNRILSETVWLQRPIAPISIQRSYISILTRTLHSITFIKIYTI